MMGEQKSGEGSSSMHNMMGMMMKMMEQCNAMMSRSTMGGMMGKEKPETPQKDKH
jgi:hypothetical protein